MADFDPLPSRWRKIAGPIISQVLKDHRGCTDTEIRKALREAYPFGERRYHPYKIWLDEIRRQRTGKPSAKPPYEGKLVFGQRPEGY